MNMANEKDSQNIQIPIGESSLTEGILRIPEFSNRIILFAHGSGSNRLSPRNQKIAEALYDAGFASLLIDLLTIGDNLSYKEEHIPSLANRFIAATDWITQNKFTADFKIGYFGASIGAAIALVAAAQRSNIVTSIILRSGYIHWAAPEFLSQIKAPTLLIIGAEDKDVIEFNRRPFEQLNEAKTKGLVIVSGANHNFDGKIEEVGRLARSWFECYF